MRSYVYLDGDISKLPGWRYVADAGRFHGPELQLDLGRPSEPTDYPDTVMLVTPIGTAFQLAPLNDRDGALLKAVAKAAKDAGITYWKSGKDFARDRPVDADLYLYERVPVLDAEGNPTGATVKKPGGKLRVAGCLAGDNAEDAADPESVVVPPVVP